MRYCQQTTKLHPLSIKFPQYLCKINFIIKENNGNSFPFDNEIAINLDKVKEVQNISNMDSMDMTFGISQGNNKKMLLVELKLDCHVITNFKKVNYIKKIKDSITLLSGGGEPIYNKHVFIFNDKLLKQSRSVIGRFLHNASAEVLSIDELKANYF